MDWWSRLFEEPTLHTFKNFYKLQWFLFVCLFVFFCAEKTRNYGTQNLRLLFIFLCLFMPVLELRLFSCCILPSLRISCPGTKIISIVFLYAFCLFYSKTLFPFCLTVQSVEGGQDRGQGHRTSETCQGHPSATSTNIKRSTESEKTGPWVHPANCHGSWLSERRKDYKNDDNLKWISMKVYLLTWSLMSFCIFILGLGGRNMCIWYQLLALISFV